MEEPEIKFIEIRKSCFVYDTSSTLVLNWLERELKGEPKKLPNTWEEMSPSQQQRNRTAGKSKQGNFLASVTLRKFTRESHGFTTQGTIFLEPIGESIFDLEYQGNGVEINFDTITLLEGQSRKMQINASCSGDDTCHALASFFSEIWKKFVSVFDAKEMPLDTAADDHTQTLPPIYAEDLERVRELSLKGLTIAVISSRTGLSESTVKRYRKEIGLRRHKRPKRDT